MEKLHSQEAVLTGISTAILQSKIKHVFEEEEKFIWVITLPCPPAIYVIRLLIHSEFPASSDEKNSTEHPQGVRKDVSSLFFVLSSLWTIWLQVRRFRHAFSLINENMGT